MPLCKIKKPHRLTPGGSENNKQQDSIFLWVIWLTGYLVNWLFG